MTMSPIAMSLLFLVSVAMSALPSLAADNSAPGDPSCKDTDQSCEYWASIGECQKNPGFMLQYCQKSCDNCGVDNCPVWKEQGLCQSNPALMYEHCGMSCDFTAYLDGAVMRALGNNQDISSVWWFDTAEIEEYMEDTKRYMRDEVWLQPGYATVRNACVNKDSMCMYWALKGRCNEPSIKFQCGPSCLACDFLDEKVRCPQSIDSLPNALRPGDVNAMFKWITSPGSEFSRYSPIVHSQPIGMGNETQDLAPWIVAFENFLSGEEIDRLLTFAEETGYQPSVETFHGDTGTNKITQERTSSNSWCGFQLGDTCFEDPVVKELLSRISKVTKVPVTNFNEIQILHYDKGQYYKTHGDYIVEDGGRRTGGRIFTFFLYLSDVEEGGETEFPRLDPPVKIKPKKGKAVLWANVLDSDPHTEDPRMWHQALPVIRGEKYAANSWIYMRDFRTPTENRC